MRKKKIIEAAVRQLEKENAWQSGTITYNQDGIVTFNGLTAAMDICADTIIKPRSKKDDTPKEFHPLLCTRCGGNLVFRNKFLVCEYCGTMYSSDLKISEKPQECYEPESKCANCGRGIYATTLDDSKPVYICGSTYGCIYEEE